jgi:amino acid adenylation domain-containing protein
MTLPSPRVRIENIYPLSAVQQGLLFHALYAPESDVYFNQLSITLRGPLDPEAFRRAWQELQRRHSMLRTRFLWEGIDEPVQVVRQDEALAWTAIDLRDLPADDETARLDALRSDDRRQRFRLDAAPPWRVTLARLGAERWFVLFSFHHVLLDGWSMGLLCKEVFALYQDLAARRSPRLPPPPPFADYIRWLSQQDLTAAETFFRDHLAERKGRTALPLEPTAYPAARADACGDDEVEVHVPPELAAAIRAFARRNQLTPSVVFDGAWAVILARYSGEDDVTFGVTVSGRPPGMPRVEDRVGIFINTLPLRVRLPAGPVVPWLHAIQAALTELTAHAHSPLVQVQQWSGLPADQLLFDTIVVYENYPVDRSLKAGAGGVVVEQVEFADRTSFPLSLTVFPHDDRFALRLAFDSRRLARAAVATLGEHLVVVLRAMTCAAPPAVEALPLLTPAEDHAIAAWEAGGALHRPATTVHGWIADAARRHPAQIAARDAAGALTYAELEARAGALGHHLRGLGVRAGARIAIAMERSTDLVVALLAVMKTGAAYVPLDPAYPTQRLAFMLRDCGAALLLTQDRVADLLPELGVATLCVDGEHATIGANPAPPVDPLGLAGPDWPAGREDDVAYVLYTSGSTGTPKGVAVSHRAVVNYLAWCREAYLGRGGEGSLVHSSISFDLTVTSLFAPLIDGQTVELAPHGGIEALDPVFSGHRDHALLKLTPAHVDALWLRHGPAARGRARAVVIGGEALTAATARAARALFPDAALFNEYGPTEAAVGCCVHEIRDDDGSGGAIPIGRPIPQVALRVLDAAMRRVPVGVTAELYIGGASLADGYLGRDELTAARFVPDPFAAAPARLYRTGDRVRYRPDGVLEFLGRVDGQVKLRGYRIELGEIDATLRSHPAAAEAVAAVTEHSGDRRLVAYVVKAPAFDGDPLAALRAAAAERLPDYMVPSQWVLLDAMPLTAHGKIDHARLPRPEPSAAGAPARPRDAIELRLLHVFKQLLGVERIGITDNFFDLGGHSLLAVRLMARIRAELGRDLPLATLIQHPTVEQLASLLRSGDGPARWSAAVAIQPVGPGTPFFCVHPAGGNVLCYAYLSQLLGEDRPFYGLQARGLEGDVPPLRSIEDMARLYVDAIRDKQPRGPYLVGGWSFGGMAAVEVARQLEAQGEVVAGLFLIDSPSFVEGAADIDIEDPRFLSYLSRFFNEDLAIAIAPDELSPLPAGERHAYLVAWARRANLVPADFSVDDLRRILRVYEACSLAHAAYRPRSLPRHVVIFRALDANHDDPLLGWGPLAQAPLEIHDAPGDHVTIMSRANVVAFAGTLRERLAAADPTSQRSAPCISGAP